MIRGLFVYGKARNCNRTVAGLTRAGLHVKPGALGPIQVKVDKNTHHQFDIKDGYEFGAPKLEEVLSNARGGVE